MSVTPVAQRHKNGHGLTMGLMLAVLFCLWATAASASIASIHTFWPLYDYRADPVTGQQRLSLLGPLLRWSDGPERADLAFRPLFYRLHRQPAADKPSTEVDVLYPLYHWERTGATSRSSMLSLYRSSDEEREGEWSLFPFLFYTRADNGEKAFAFFPFGGTIRHRFGRDRIDFWLFPLYGRTQRNGTTITNILWPFFAEIEGEGVEGFKLWPLYGQVEKAGSYRRYSFLWPFLYRQQERLDTDTPVLRQGIFPFWMEEESASRSSTQWLWPFFSHQVNRDKGFEETWAPWPLYRRMEGDGWSSFRLLPFYADEHSPGGRDRWWLWPLFKREEQQWDGYYRRRNRFLYFWGSQLEEGSAPDRPELQRVALWPFFTWERRQQVERFHTLSLLEPFFPDNEAIEHLWSPLWRLYQSVHYPDGRSAHSLLWNLYWDESQGKDRALELFPLVFYRRQEQDGLFEWRLLKGVLGYRRTPTAHTFYFLFLPIPLGAG